MGEMGSWEATTQPQSDTQRCVEHVNETVARGAREEWEWLYNKREGTH